MKVVCLNAWGGKLYDELVGYLREEAPDVLCLQEVTQTPQARTDWLTYRDGQVALRQRASLFRDLTEALPEHTAMFFPAAQGPLWDGDRPIGSQWGIATFVHRRFPVIAQAQGFVHKRYSPHDFGPHPRSRNAHALTIYDYEQDRAISIAHMHGLRDPSGKHDTPGRRLQAQRLLDLIGSIAGSDAPLIICGDFNVEPESETLRILKAVAPTELVTSRATDGTRTSHYTKQGRYADYMLVNDRVSVLGFAVRSKPEVSDHRPLVLEI